MVRIVVSTGVSEAVVVVVMSVMVLVVMVAVVVVGGVVVVVQGDLRRGSTTQNVRTRRLRRITRNRGLCPRMNGKLS